MKKVVFFLFISVFSFGQNFAKDTIMINGTQPATILKLSNHKIYILQNKELQTPYLLQKDNSFISAGIPDVQISIFGNNLENPYLFIEHLFNSSELEINETKELFKNAEDISIYIEKSEKIKEKIIILSALYPLKNELISVKIATPYKDETDKTNKLHNIRGIIEKGLMVLENYYVYRKE